MDSIDRYYTITRANKKKRSVFPMQIFIIAVYAFLLLCFLTDWRWWEGRPVIACVVSFFYFFVVAAFDRDKYDSIFNEIDAFYRSKEHYIESQSIILGDYFSGFRSVGIADGDFLVLSDNHFYEVYYEVYFDASYIKLKEINSDKVVYSVERSYISSLEAKRELVELLKNDKVEMYAIYNRFGDIKWLRSDKYKEVPKMKKWIYRAAPAALRVLYSILSFGPAVPAILILFFFISSTK